MTNRPTPSKEKASCENASIMVVVGLRESLVWASTVTKARRRAQQRLERVNDKVAKSVEGETKEWRWLDDLPGSQPMMDRFMDWAGGKCELGLISRKTAPGSFNGRRILHP